MQMTEALPRRRRGAFHADSNEEYMMKLKSSDLATAYTTPPMSDITAYSPPDRLEDYLTKQQKNDDSPPDQFSSRRRHKQNNDTWNFIENPGNPFDHINESPRKSSDTNETGCQDSEMQRHELLSNTVTIKVMIVAERSNIGPFLGYLCQNDKESTPAFSYPLDFALHTKKTEKQELKYHFWLKECLKNEVSNVLKALYMVYYKTSSFIVFLYSVNNKESFVLISQRIKSLASEFESRQFKGVLIGLKLAEINSQSENAEARQVTHEEGEQLKQEHGLKEFLEVDLSKDSYRAEVFRMMESLKK